MVWEIEISMRIEEDLDEEGIKQLIGDILRDAGLDVSIDRVRKG